MSRFMMRGWIRWVLAMIWWIAVLGSVVWWIRFAPGLSDVDFDLDWLVWAGAGLSVYLLARTTWRPWRKAVTHERKLRWWHILLMRVPVMNTVGQVMSRQSYRVGAANAARHAVARGFEYGRDTRGGKKRSHKRQIQKAVDASLLDALEEMGM